MSGRRAAALAAVAALLPAVLPVVAASVQPGDPLPAFQLEDLNGRPVALEQFAGRVISVHFFAVWCEPCLAELPVIEKTASRYGPRGYQPLLVAVANREDARRLREFVQKHGLDIPVLYDGQRAVEQLYGLKALPTHLVAGRDGLVRSQSTALPATFPADIAALVDEKIP